MIYFYMWLRKAMSSIGTLTVYMGILLSTTVATAELGGITKLAVGPDASHVCVIPAAGGAMCWGSNISGQVGIGSTANSSAARPVTALQSDASDISTGSGHTCAVTSTGALICWGSNGSGRLGDGTTTNSLIAVTPVGMSSGVTNSATGVSHTCAIISTGALKCWGDNSDGKLGDGTTTSRSSPVDVIGLTSGVASVGAGNSNTCALTTNGGVKCWGYNVYGAVGDGTTTTRHVPTDVTGMATGVSAISVSSHVCALTTSGGIKCWGWQSYGQTGSGIVTSYHTNPVNVVGLTSGVASFSAGGGHTCAVTTSGGAKCWGFNDNGQLGSGGTDWSNVPVDVSSLTSGVSSLSAGSAHTCALLTSATIRCWGLSNNGTLGDGTRGHRYIPTNVVGLNSEGFQVSNPSGHTCAVTTAGGVRCWGDNYYGKLGDGTVYARHIPVDVNGLASGAYVVETGTQHTCALTTAGGVKCWGDNNYRQVGDGTATARYTPVDVSTLTAGVSKLTVGSSHTCVVTTSGGAKCWGRNSYGQLGDSSTTTRSTPVDVSGLTSGVTAISAGYWYTCALTVLGGVKCWGHNSSGQLGNGTYTHSSSPVDVLGLNSGIVAIDNGNYHSCALTSSGAILCWGSGSSGQLGNGTTTGSVIPVAVTNLTSGVSKVSAGNGQSCALLTAGGVKCWGLNFGGYLGDGSNITRLTPVFPTGMSSGVSHISAGNSSTCAVTTSGGVKCWGINSLGCLGLGQPSLIAPLHALNINGSVTLSGQSLVGASLLLSNVGDMYAESIVTTDSNGLYTLTHVESGTYTITPELTGYTFTPPSLSGTMASDFTQDFVATAIPYNITGTVTAGGTALAGVTIDGGSLGTQITDGSGAYSFTGVGFGTSYTLTPSLANYEFTPTANSGTVSGDVSHDFTAVYNPSLTTTTSVAVTTTTVPVSTTEPTTTAETTSVATTTVETSSTIVAGTSTVASTSTVMSTTSVATTTTLGEDVDTDNDGVTDSEELTAGTNPNDPGSKAPKLRTTLCSDWNGYLGGTSGRGMYNIMEHINLTTKKVRVKTELRSIRGHLKDTYEFFLRGNQQFDFLVHDMGGREPNSYGQVCTTYERAPAGSLDGRMAYYKFSDAGDIQFAFALPFENPSTGTSALLYNTVQPSLNPADSGNLVANWVQLSNVSKKRLKGRFYFHRPDGTQLTKPVVNPELVEVDVNLRDGARYDYSVHSYGVNLTGLIRFVPRDKTVEYQLREVRYLYDNPGTEDSFASAYPFGAAVGSGETMIAAVDASDSSAVLELGNMLATNVAANIKLYDSNGNTLLYSKAHSLKAYGSVHVALDPYLVRGKGVVVVKASTARVSATNISDSKAATSPAGSLLGQVVHYSRSATGSLQNMYAMPLREPIGTSMRGSYNTYLNQGCTLYLANAANAKEKVTVSIKQNDGTSPVQDYKLTVPGRGMLAEDICSKSPQNVYGVVTVRATKPKRIYGAVVRSGDAGRYKMGTEMR